MKKLLLIALSLLVSYGLFAEFVPRKDAEKVAKSHYYQSINSIKQTNWEKINLDCQFNPTNNDIYNFYVFNINGDEGWVIVSSDNDIMPILAYSFEGDFNNFDMAPTQKEMLNYYDDCIDFASKNEMQPRAKDVNEWDALLNYSPDKSIKQKSTSRILLEHINWNQDWPYNSGCPVDAGGSGGHVYVGCVATAMLQVMKYYNWPETGTGQKYHSSFYNGGYGNININFAEQTYDWYSIPNKASSYVNEELGKINFHAGVAVRMMWGPDGSGTQTYLIADALEDYFNYSSDAQHVSKYNYSESEWQNLIKAQIDAGMPTVYSGNPAVGGAGHAWNCDGYQDDSFHMNWGWGGAGNGYYTLDNLTSTATAGGDENNFNTNNDMIINIYPDEAYQDNCSGTKIITGHEGSFSDGSPRENYDNNQSCVYVIEPTCGKVINLSFNDFNLGEGDELIVFDGDETSTTVLASYDADNDPGINTLSTNVGAITLKFNTDGSSNSLGWNVDYTVKNCNTGLTYTDGSGSFDDGSGICEYANSNLCTWIIEPEDANYITITFDEFELAGNIDFVKIYENELSSSNTIATFNSGTAPSEPITVNSGTAIIQFFTDGTNTADGWEISYTSLASDIEENKFLSNFSIMPNPGNVNSILEFSITNNSDAVVTVTNLLGEIIATKEYSLNSGLHNFTLNEIVNTELEAGIYSISINANNQTQTQKLVVVE